MDLVEVLSNLHALRQLYELLQNIEDGLQHINAKNVHNNLDVRARKLLKDLLDEATEKMFNTRLKVIEAQSAVHQTPCASQLEQPKAMPKLRYSLSLDSVKSSLNSVLNNEKDSKSSKSASKKDEKYPMKHQASILESKVSTSPDLPQYEKKRCHVCIAKDMKKHYSTKEATMFNERTEGTGQKQS
ncbi:hypothetical protein M0R45_005771 [Rubus argutus]|uniref:Uncharacterized protein n=1 Tax=Rubus argutus TaxID=59490 RepID=A0AAW1YNQ5_RUBAR